MKSINEVIASLRSTGLENYASDVEKVISLAEKIDLDLSDESIKKIQNDVKAPYVDVGKPPLDDGTSIYVHVSLDKKKDWAHGYFINSRHSTFFIYKDGIVEQTDKSYQIKDKFRKSKARSIDEAINKINKYVELINQSSTGAAMASNNSTDSDEIEKGDSVRLIKDKVKKYPMTGIYLSVNTLIVRNILGETCWVGRNFKEDECISVKKKDLYIVKKGKDSKESEFFNETTAGSKNTKLKIKTLKDLYESQGYEYFIDSKLGNDLFINDPDRADRIHKYAEEGLNGSTHQETIEDWRDYLNTLKVFDPEFEDDDEDLSEYDITQETYDNISKEIYKTEKWHKNNRSINKIIG